MRLDLKYKEGEGFRLKSIIYNNYEWHVFYVSDTMQEMVNRLIIEFIRDLDKEGYEE